MSRAGKGWIGVALGLTGLGLSFVRPEAAIVAALGPPVALGAGVRVMNSPKAQLAYALSVLLFTAATYQATGSPIVTAAAFVAAAPGAPSEAVTRRLGYKGVWIVSAAIVASLVLLAIGWSSAARPWVVLPPIAMNTFMAINIHGLVRELGVLARPKWNIKVGELVPSFVGKDRAGNDFSLEALRGKHVALMFVRGDWCPVCHVAMRVYQKESAMLAKHNVQIIVVSASSGEESVQFAKELAIDITLLADPECTVAALFGAVHPSAGKGPTLALPSSFLIGPDGRLVFSSRADDLASFLDPRSIPRLIEAGGDAVRAAA